ncbi:DNA cytosine methyltransferase [Siphonobacter sp. SORGH_AS_1065]|uniref:DNA cytosine methyltransferase n=1 Tax=Siphonobacter sp. SORGH_AS_1065 TaxID=3041795 RepID=UPI002783B961|nr:DNA (cytosine-5-)-methyltransferase [Siphonobacter sp. SORGH_AS_1065]MDQ1088616.1 DNA (cytosine-5)-methyltransferase 1 [Siphonobacter sp. SORGH_AS_1065]
MRFIDLFAGLGGFHKALSDLGHECVYASEINLNLQKIYFRNWDIVPHGDIRKIVNDSIDQIPEHDILCAGFPCQPFSKAGKQEGKEDKERGTLFDEIIKILNFRKPSYFILENVAYLAKHKNEETWVEMKIQLENEGYQVDHKVYSPHQLGIPQHRERIFIVGSRLGLDNFKWFDDFNTNVGVENFIEDNPEDSRIVPYEEFECLKIWQNLIDALPLSSKLISPLWGMEFGADYPFEEFSPAKLRSDELGEYKGNFGISLEGLSKEDQLKNLPSYSRDVKDFPSWKKTYIRKSRDFYKDNKNYIEDHVKELSKYNSQSWQKLEWNVGEYSERNIFKNIIQFRASGLRVKKPDFFPSLVCTHTQVPIIGWQNRYITRREGARLQALDGIILPDNDAACFRALGNAVNAHIVKRIAEDLIPFEHHVMNNNLQLTEC